MAKSRTSSEDLPPRPPGVASRSSDFTPRSPDFTLSVFRKSDSYKGSVGCAWLQPDGTISIKLNPFVVLDASSLLKITLFPIKDEESVEDSSSSVA